MKKESELRKCPFCGGNATVFNADETCYVQCDDCKSSGTPSKYYSSAVAQWNMRKVENYLNEQIEDMKKVLRSMPEGFCRFHKENDLCILTPIPPIYEEAKNEMPIL